MILFIYGMLIGIVLTLIGCFIWAWQAMSPKHEINHQPQEEMSNANTR